MITTANQCSQDSDADVFLDENQLGARWHVTTRMLQVDGILDSETLISFKVYSKHDLDSMFEIGFEQP